MNSCDKYWERTVWSRVSQSFIFYSNSTSCPRRLFIHLPSPLCRKFCSVSPPHALTWQHSRLTGGGVPCVCPRTLRWHHDSRPMSSGPSVITTSSTLKVKWLNQSYIIRNVAQHCLSLLPQDPPPTRASGSTIISRVSQGPCQGCDFGKRLYEQLHFIVSFSLSMLNYLQFRGSKTFTPP